MKPRERLASMTTPSRRRGEPALPPRLGYPFAVAVPVLVTLVVIWIDDPDYRVGTAFIAAVALVAAVAGTAPSVVATVASTVGFWYAVAPPPGSFRIEWPQTMVSLLTFVVSCLAVVLVVHQRDRAGRRATAMGRRYRRLADLGLIGITFWELDGPITGANDSFLAMVGYSRQDLIDGLIDWKRLTPPEYEVPDAEKIEELVANGFHDPYEKEYLRKDGTRVPVLVGTAFLEGSEHEGISFILDMTERWQLEHEREALLESERRALLDAEAATRRLQVVAAASARLMAQLDPDAVVHELADVIVPELADMVSVWHPVDGQLHRAVTAHATHTQLAEVLTSHFAVVARRDSVIAECFRRGTTILVPDMSIRGVEPVEHDAEYEQAIRALELTEGVVIPIKVGREVLGVLSLSGTLKRGPLEPGAVLAAEQIAERAAVALQKAQSFAEEREIASLMQRALLPDSQRTVVGHEVATCYVPAAVGREIGGDWWDVLKLPDGRVGLIVGDVSGHGVHVAPSMAKLRHSIDGVLVHGATPAEAATAASRLLEINRPGSYATAFVAVYDPCTRELVYSRAGHPPPLLVLGDDLVVSLDHPGGTLLGLNQGERSQDTIELPESFELVAFTDGLVEEPGLPYDDGVDRLVRAVRALPDDLAGQPRAERLVADIIGTTGRDDVCVMLMRPSSR